LLGLNSFLSGFIKVFLGLLICLFSIGGFKVLNSKLDSLLGNRKVFLSSQEFSLGLFGSDFSFGKLLRIT
jgi:hypothetical protein